MKKYEDILMEILSFHTEDIIRTSGDGYINGEDDGKNENVGGMPEFPEIFG